MNQSTSNTMFTIANFQCVVYAVFMTGILAFLFHLIINKIQHSVSLKPKDKVSSSVYKWLSSGNRNKTKTQDLLEALIDLEY